MKTIRERIIEQPSLSTIPGIVHIVKLLEDEFSSLHKAIEKKERNSTIDTVEMLHPGYRNRKLPVVGLAALDIEQQQQLTLEKIFEARIGETTFMFAPVYEGELYPLQVKYLATRDKWWEQRTDGIVPKQELSWRQGGRLILGLTWNGHEQTNRGYGGELDGMQLYFEGLEEKYLPYLSLVEVIFENIKYALEPALFDDKGYVDTHSLDKEFVNLYHHRKKAASQFLGLFRLRKTDKKVFEPLALPTELKDMSGVGWLQIKLPEVIPDAIFTNLEINANVFPIWNVQLSRLTRTCDKGKEIVVPIEIAEGESFFALERIWSHAQRPYAAKGLFPTRNETYQLLMRDPRNLLSIDFEGTIANLLQAIDQLDLNGLAALSINNNDDFQEFRQNLKEITDKWSPIKPKLAIMGKSLHYLKLYPNTENKVVHIDFLTSQPEAGGILWRKETDLETEAVLHAKLITVPEEYGKQETTFEEQFTDVKNRFDFLLKSAGYE